MKYTVYLLLESGEKLTIQTGLSYIQAAMIEDEWNFPSPFPEHDECPIIVGKMVMEREN